MLIRIFFWFLLALWSVISLFIGDLWFLHSSSPAVMVPSWCLLPEVDFRAPPVPFVCSGSSLSSAIHCLSCAVRLLWFWGILVPMSSDNFVRNVHAVRPLSSGEYLF